jgi:serine/threonine protein kinase
MIEKNAQIDDLKLLQCVYKGEGCELWQACGKNHEGRFSDAPDFLFLIITIDQEATDQYRRNYFECFGSISKYVNIFTPKFTSLDPRIYSRDGVQYMCTKAPMIHDLAIFDEQSEKLPLESADLIIVDILCALMLLNDCLTIPLGKSLSPNQILIDNDFPRPRALLIDWSSIVCADSKKQSPEKLCKAHNQLAANFIRSFNKQNPSNFTDDITTVFEGRTSTSIFKRIVSSLRKPSHSDYDIDALSSSVHKRMFYALLRWMAKTSEDDKETWTVFLKRWANFDVLSDDDREFDEDKQTWFSYVEHLAFQFYKRDDLVVLSHFFKSWAELRGGFETIHCTTDHTLVSDPEKIPKQDSDDVETKPYQFITASEATCTDRFEYREITIGEVLWEKVKIKKFLGVTESARFYLGITTNMLQSRQVFVKQYLTNIGVIEDFREAFIKFENDWKNAGARLRFQTDSSVSDKLLKRAETTPELSDVVALPLHVNKDQCYIITEFVQGHNLKDFVSQNHWKLSFPDKACMLYKLLTAFNSIHKAQICHGDPSPRNIMVEESNNVVPTLSIKLIDFDFARIRKTQSQIYRGHTGGTPSFTAPEAFDSIVSYNEKSDLYVVGLNLYYLVMNQYPNSKLENKKAPALIESKAQSIEELCKNTFEPIYHALTEVNPNERMASAAEAIRLVELLFGEDVNSEIIDPTSKDRHEIEAQVIQANECFLYEFCQKHNETQYHALARQIVEQAIKLPTSYIREHAWLLLLAKSHFHTGDFRKALEIAVKAQQSRNKRFPQQIELMPEIEYFVGLSQYVAGRAVGIEQLSYSFNNLSMAAKNSTGHLKLKAIYFCGVIEFDLANESSDQHKKETFNRIFDSYERAVAEIDFAIKNGQYSKQNQIRLNRLKSRFLMKLLYWNLIVIDSSAFNDQKSLEFEELQSLQTRVTANLNQVVQLSGNMKSQIAGGCRVQMIHARIPFLNSDEALEQALSTIDEILVDFSDNSKGYLVRVRLYRRLKLFDKALKDLETLIELEGETPRILYRMGSTLLEMEKFEEAIETLERCHDIPLILQLRICHKLKEAYGQLGHIDKRDELEVKIEEISAKLGFNSVFSMDGILDSEPCH